MAPGPPPAREGFETVAERLAASLREKPRSLPSSAAFSSAGRSGEVMVCSFPLPLWERVARTRGSAVLTGGGAWRGEGCSGGGGVSLRELCLRGKIPLIRRFAPPSPTGGEGKKHHAT